MDVLDAGAFVAKWEASVPEGLKTVLWGPLQAKEMGFDGWEWQDGGETGFVAHNPHIRLPAGFGTSTLIVVNRLRRAFLTVYFGGYPANAPRSQRRLDAQKVASACEVFLSRLAKQEVHFEFQGEVALVDNINDDAVEASAGTHQLPRGDAVKEEGDDAREDAREEARPVRRDEVWEV